MENLERFQVDRADRDAIIQRNKEYYDSKEVKARRDSGELKERRVDDLLNDAYTDIARKRAEWRILWDKVKYSVMCIEAGGVYMSRMILRINKKPVVFKAAFIPPSRDLNDGLGTSAFWMTDHEGTSLPLAQSSFSCQLVLVT